MSQSRASSGPEAAVLLAPAGILLELAHITVQMLLAHAVESSVAQYGRANRAIRPPEVALAGANPT